MAEYNEVIKQFKRMCRYTNRSGLPQDCPLYCKGHGCNISHCRMLAFDDKKFADLVAKWAAEHPEQKYPTWAEWLESVHVLTNNKSVTYKDGNEIYGAKYYQSAILNTKFYQPIPADIAQKLGIQPKEADHD